MRATVFATAVTLGSMLLVGVAFAADLSIYEIQSNTTNGDASYYDYINYGALVDCAGGVVVAKLDRTVPRLILADPNYPDAWGGIQVKDLMDEAGVFDDVQVGDWVRLVNVEVEEYRGTTFLQMFTYNDPNLAVIGGLRPIPPPIEVAVGDIPAPLTDPNDPNSGWFVENHDAEPYESMRLVIRDVIVTDMGLGKAYNNYNLQDPQGENCWASDYMNKDKPAEPNYHDFVGLEQHFAQVGGILEQYTKLATKWDYYQLLTLSTADLAVRGDTNCDGVVDFGDINSFVMALSDPTTWQEAFPGCSIMSADVNTDGEVDFGDINPFVALLSG